MNKKSKQTIEKEEELMGTKKSYSYDQGLVKNVLLGVGITNATKQDILEYIITSLTKKREAYFVVTPNPEILVFASKNKDFKNILNNAKIALCDGVGLMLADKFVAKPFRERFTGVDLLESLCSRVCEKPITVGFLGGRNNVAERTVECLKRKCPNLKVGFVGEEWAGGHGVDLLFVAFGFPKQEQWMAQNLEKGYFRVAVGVGGAFDYISGQIPRAPKFIRDLGLEWLFRLFVQPWRWKRQLALLEFLWLVIKEKLGNK